MEVTSLKGKNEDRKTYEDEANGAIRIPFCNAIVFGQVHRFLRDLSTTEENQSTPLSNSRCAT
jgi:hypothetical protein